MPWIMLEKHWSSWSKAIIEGEAVPVAVPECEGVRLSFFGNLSENEAVPPVDVPECEGEASPIGRF